MLEETHMKIILTSKDIDAANAYISKHGIIPEQNGLNIGLEK
jgi:hypothetical protein